MTDETVVEEPVAEPVEQPKYAFRCKNCGRLETSGNAGELSAPAACPVCGYGVSYDPIRGLKSYHPENWEVLADLAPKEQKALAEDHGVAVDELIEIHVPAEPVPTDREPMEIERSATEGLGQADDPDGAVK